MAERPDQKNGVDVRIARVEQAVAAISSKMDSLSESVRTLTERESQPTNWIGIGSLVGGSFLFLIAFVKMLADPIQAKLIELNDQHYAFLDRFNQHIADGHPASVIQMVNANRDADLERMRQHEMFDAEVRRLEEKLSDEREQRDHEWMDRLRERVARLESAGKRP